MPGYLPILILGAAAVGFGVFTVVVSHLIGRPRPDAAKLSTYECGMPPVGTARERFPIKFYLVCMIFILLDVDAAFLYPWALIFRDLGLYGLVEMGVFVALLGGGFAYAWKVGALDW
ncbi:MAG: NADH-quinone oxidoreductase subunit A [Acidobacteria bacterium RBG_16_70_10]|nr:MAG: NADH-quinone oxidoreductase subunit A [Acidobacteria bacterium RBG_16_70_10]